MTAARRERAHGPSSQPGWEEAWDFEFAAPGGPAGYVHLGLHPADNVAWYWACLVIPDRPGPVVVHDREVPLPRTQALEVRSDALWAELVCETPMEHWSIGLEAFGVVLDDADAALDPRGEVGERIAVGLDLEWELMGPPYPDDPGDGTNADDYSQYGAVRGTVLLGRDELPCDAVGARRHRWGPHDWHVAHERSAWSVGTVAVTMDGEGLDSPMHGCVWNSEAGGVPVSVSGVEVTRGVAGPAALPSTLVAEVPGVGVVEGRLLAAAPLLLSGATGRWRSRLLRGLYHHRITGPAAGSQEPGTTGLGWHELLLPE